MNRRELVRSLGLGGTVALLSGCRTGRESHQPNPYSVGTLDLSALDVIDVHVHPPRPVLPSAADESSNESFVEAIIEAGNLEPDEALRSRLSEDFRKQLHGLPREIGLSQYVARTYGVKPTLQGFDSVVAKHIEGDFTEYVSSILEREKIAAVVLQSSDSMPRRPTAYVPADRFVWIYPFFDFIQPMWARSQGAEHIEDVVQSLNEVLETCAANGCVGLKNGVAYYRPLAVERVSREDADQALRALLSHEPSRFRSTLHGVVPEYADTQLRGQFRAYQDFLLKHLFVKAGELGLRIVIHTAVGLHPALRFELNDPRGLHDVFLDGDIQRAGTEFVLIHTGYPYHHFVAAMLTQFPNVFADVSFFTAFPGMLEDILRVFLAFAPSEKIMHGSDSSTVPEKIGYCADNLRRVLARVLDDFREGYGWTEDECRVVAENVMSENARRVFRIGQSDSRR